MAFEVVSTAFKNSESIYEEAPYPSNQLGFIYRNDGKGPGSNGNGFYVMFKQGSLELADLTIDTPTPNEKIAVESPNINNDDVWMFTLGANNAQLNQWAKVSNLVGNNIAYNSLSRNIRNIYSVVTKENDKIELVFADGVYGNVPQGKFRVYYRVSNGLSYSISPAEMRGIAISIPYVNKNGAKHTITVGLGLQQTISNAATSESVASIRTNAPAVYYTQNRMITGEDYNLAPLASSQDILKIKAVNRTSSGISRNFEIIDVSGKYSSINVFADDGYIYKDDIEHTLSFKFNTKNDIINAIRRIVEPAIAATDVYNFYVTKYNKKLFDGLTTWNQCTADTNLTTGYFLTNSVVKKVGPAYATNNLRYIAHGAMVKFIPVTGMAFKNGKMITANAADPMQTKRIWAKVIKVVGDGTNNGLGILSSGAGTISFNDIIPSGAIIDQVVPKLVTDLPAALESEMVNQAYQNVNFGLRYDVDTTAWQLITSANINLSGNFNLITAGDTTNTNSDASWIVAFVKEAEQYTVRIRALDYVFGSVSQNRFYFDAHEKAYNDQLGAVIKDSIKILGINTGADKINLLNTDVTFEISDTVKFNDGYISNSEVKLAFSDADSDGVIDNPESFVLVVGEDTGHLVDSKGNDQANLYVFFKEIKDGFGNVYHEIVDTSTTNIIVRESEATTDITEFVDGQLIYFYNQTEDYVKLVNRTTNTFNLISEYTANIGRTGLKFQYLHNASSSRRIDPSVSNIMDISIMTRTYDTAFRSYLRGGISTPPEPPSSDALRISFGSKLNAIKSISDEIIYHPVRYKVLFGAIADEKLQAQFKVVKNPNKTINDNDLKVRIVTAINEFFDITYWDFGDRFYLGELTTYILNSVSPDISNIIIVPKQATQSFGSLFEIQSKHDEILVSGATVDNIDIVTAISATEVRASSTTITSST